MVSRFERDKTPRYHGRASSSWRELWNELVNFSGRRLPGAGSCIHRCVPSQRQTVFDAYEINVRTWDLISRDGRRVSPALGDILRRLRMWLQRIDADTRRSGEIFLLGVRCEFYSWKFTTLCTRCRATTVHEVKRKNLMLRFREKKEFEEFVSNCGLTAIIDSRLLQK